MKTILIQDGFRTGSFLRRFDRSSIVVSPLWTARLRLGGWLALVAALGFWPRAGAQTLINIDCGVGTQSAKVGFAGTGQGTNDFWNVYRHYEPKFLPGMPLVSEGVLEGLKLADGSPTKAALSVTNAPGVWGNTSGDAMFDTYIFAQNESNITAAIRGLEPGRYHFYLYGHADPDVTGEQNSVFWLRSGTNSFGPLTTVSAPGWRNDSSWREGYQHVVFRDVPVAVGLPVLIEVGPGVNGIPVLNGMQISSRGTSPPKRLEPAAGGMAEVMTNLMFREIQYEGRVSEAEARFQVRLEVESMTTNEIAGPLFEGDVALIIPVLPEGVRVVSRAKEYTLLVRKPGVHRLDLEVVTKITRAEPWNTISFVGPPAAIASIQAEAGQPGVEMQLLSGTSLGAEGKAGSRVQGFLGSDRRLALRWQSKTAEVTRKSLVTVDTLASAQIMPTVIKHTTQFRYEILQAGVPRLLIALPASHALTRLEGEQVRDWQVRPDGAQQLLTVEFIKPVEKTYSLTLHSEQAIESTPFTAQLVPPQPLEIERESGSFTISADDMVVEFGTLTGLRQVNAPAGALAAFRFYGRPVTLAAELRRIEPVIKSTDRVTIRLEETRLRVLHALSLTVEKAGIYGLDLTPQSGFVVAGVRGEGVEDWKAAGGKLQVAFGQRLIGQRQLEVELEQAFKTFPEQVMLEALRVGPAETQSALVGAAAALGISLKTGADLSGLREVSVSSLPGRSDEQLAYRAEQGDWRLTLAVQRLPARIVAEVFNLVTIGEGLVGGSATIRYGLINQGVQEFKIRLPAHWKNVDFTGPNIRRKDQAGDMWVLALQDKAWGGYTLVITYDYPFEPAGATLDLAGAHAVDVERETGSVAVTSAANIDLEKASPAEPLRQMDPSELTETERALITRPVLLAYKYAGNSYRLDLKVTRHPQAEILDAVADRTQLTTVLTEEGQMLTQASFMVKNNEMQYQRFLLPPDAKLWACYVNNQPVKAEMDTNRLAVALPRGANRDEAFAVDLVYAQKIDPLKSRVFRKTLSLEAPRTDVPNTYAEWQVYVPPTQRLSRFGGNMTVARGTTYGLRDAWNRARDSYRAFSGGLGAMILFLGGVLVIVLGCVWIGRRHGSKGVVTVVAVLGLLLVIGGLLLPSLAKSKARAQRISGLSNLKQIGLAAPVPPPAAAQPAPPTDANLQVEAPPVQPPGVVAAPVQQQAVPQTATVAVGMPPLAGLRSIRIDVPRTGQPFTFTKVLNVNDQLLTVRMSVVRAKVARIWQSFWRLAAGVGGLLLVWRCWQRLPRRSFGITVGLVLLGWSVVSVLLATRLLHLVLVGVPPLLLLVVVALSARRFRLRRAGVAAGEGGLQSPVPGTSPDPAGPTGAPPAVALIAFALCLSQVAAVAQTQPGAKKTSATEARALPLISILSARYTGGVQDPVAEFTAQLKISSAGTNQTVLLFGDDVAVREFACTNPAVQFLRMDSGVGLRLPDRGEVAMEIKFAVKLAGDVSKRQLSFGIPPALSSQLIVTLGEPDADVEFPTAVAFRRSTADKTTRVEAVLGAGDRVDLHWTPRVKRTAEMAASVFVQNTSLATVGGGVVNARSVLDYQVSQGELRQAKVRLPAGQRLLRVEGEWIRTWELSAPGAEQVLTVDLVKAISQSYRLTIETESLLEQLPASVRVELPGAIGVIRETGLLGLRATEEVNLTVETVSGLQRVDPAEFAGTDAFKSTTVQTAYRFLKPGFQLTMRAEAVSPQIEAVARNSLRVGFEKVQFLAEVDYTIKKAGVFSFKLALPVGYKLETVEGTNILRWSETADPRTLEVALKERTAGSYALKLRLNQSQAEVPQTLAIAGVRPLNVQKLTGFVSAAAEAGLSLKTRAFEGLTEIPAALLPGAGQRPGQSSGLLAFKFIADDAPAATAWSLSVGVEVVESWKRAEIINIVRVTETLVSGRSLVRYDIQNAPVKDFRLRIPATYTNVDVHGADIRRRDQQGQEWRVELQNKVRGIYTLTFTWERPWNARTNALLDLTGPTALEVERETGYLVVEAQAPLQVSEREITPQLVRSDARELPDWAGVSATAAVSVYRYLRPDYRLVLETRRFQDAAVLQALGDSARLTTVVADDGQMMTEMSLAVRNNGLQFLEIALPEGTREVWSVFVAGQAVRPAQAENKVLIPLERSGPEEPPVSVELTFVGLGKFPKNKGRVELVSPKLGIPLKNAQWDVYLPPDYAYSKFEGTMSYEGEGGLQVFSSREYFRQEQQKKAARRSEFQSFLSNVRSQLTAGKLKAANEDYNQALRLNEPADTAAKEELQNLKKDLGRIQGSNLIQAQRRYTVDNVNRYGQQKGAPEMVQQVAEQAPGRAQQETDLLQYDLDTAEKQWGALQRAQEVTLAQVQPLHVNLPLRGLRQSFSQVLQTEVNKPMTVRFLADNADEIGWFSRMVSVLGGFLVLWIFVGVIVNRVGRSAS